MFGLGFNQGLGINRAPGGGVALEGFLMGNPNLDTIWKIDMDGNVSTWDVPATGRGVNGGIIAPDGSGRVFALAVDDGDGVGVDLWEYAEGEAFNSTGAAPTNRGSVDAYAYDRGVQFVWDMTAGKLVTSSERNGATDSISSILDASPYTYTDERGSPDYSDIVWAEFSGDRVYIIPRFSTDLLYQDIGSYSTAPTTIGSGLGTFVTSWACGGCIIPSDAPNMGGVEYIMHASNGNTGQVHMHRTDTGVPTSTLWSSLSDSCRVDALWYDPISELVYMQIVMNSGTTYNGIRSIEPGTTTFDILDTTEVADMSAEYVSQSRRFWMEPIYSGGDQFLDTGFPQPA